VKKTEPPKLTAADLTPAGWGPPNPVTVPAFPRPASGRATRWGVALGASVVAALIAVGLSSRRGGPHPAADSGPQTFCTLAEATRSSTARDREVNLSVRPPGAPPIAATPSPMRTFPRPETACRTTASRGLVSAGRAASRVDFAHRAPVRRGGQP
jgi:hypothetical protein